MPNKTREIKWIDIAVAIIIIAALIYFLFPRNAEDLELEVVPPDTTSDTVPSVDGLTAPEGAGLMFAESNGLDTSGGGF